MDSLSKTFLRFFDSKISAGILLIACTALSLSLANSPLGPDYQDLWQRKLGGLSVAHWINDALMAVFFLFIGLELEREFYCGELSDVRNAVLPIVAAAGGMLAPALIHFSLNQGTPAQAGFGIPMATDIAFALGVLAMLGNRIPPSLKVFVVAFAVIDDLGAIIVIAAFYTAQLSAWYFAGALVLYGLLIVLNRLRVMSLVPYLAGGVAIWFLLLNSGLHATLAGVMLAFAIPFSSRDDDDQSPSHKLEHFLHKPVAFVILPIFALANTGVVLGPDWLAGLGSANSIGIAAGLLAGKTLGVMLFCYAAVATGLCQLPAGLRWSHIIGAGLLGGIGFTMAIFVASLAFAGNAEAINASKLAIFLASLTAGIAGYLWLRLTGAPRAAG